MPQQLAQGTVLGACPRGRGHGTQHAWRERCWLGMALVAVFFISGCGPSKANIQLRKDKQKLEAQVQSLQQQVAADRARIESLEGKVGTVPTLPEARLDQMFTVHGMKLGRSTGGFDLDPSKPGDEGLKVYLTPVDENGDGLPATGYLTIGLFDLSRPDQERIGLWEFTPEQMKGQWRSLMSLHAFVFTLPWQQVPRDAELAVKVSFRDDLTGRTYSELKQINIDLPAATRPTTRISE